MWQIQVCEINRFIIIIIIIINVAAVTKLLFIGRPGNFSSHARNCLELLIDVLVSIKDLSSLLFITQQLKSKIEPSR